MIIDGLTVVALLLVVAALVLALGVDHGDHSRTKVECLIDVRNIVGLLEAMGDDYPSQGGSAFVLSLVVRGDLVGEDKLNLLFCPGDDVESLRLAGGVRAYDRIDLSGDLDHLTSYAGRAQERSRCRIRRGAERAAPVALVSDDSEDHHGRNGFVVGYTGGATRWRDKVDDWNLGADAAVVVGRGSAIEELRCLRSD